ncbi:hypothetical protein N9L33_01370 [Nitrospinae bacterium]|nr:hypothetical protein [Nitrospinota bacterium]
MDNIISRYYFNFLTLKDLNSLGKPLEFLEEEEFEIAHHEVGADLMKKLWNLSPKVTFASFDSVGHETSPPFSQSPE